MMGSHCFFDHLFSRYGTMTVENAHRGSSVDALINALRDSDSSVRNEAAEALRELQAPEAIEPLIQLLKSPPDTARYAFSLLERIDEPRVIHAFIEALKSAHPSVRVSAADVLLKSQAQGTDIAADVLIREMKSSDSGIRRYAVATLSSVGIEMNCSHAPLRQRAARVLEKIGKTRAVDALIEALHDPDHEVRLEAVSALGGIVDDRAVGPLIGALTDSDNTVRLFAASSLGFIGKPQAVEPLLLLLKEPDPEMCRAAAKALHGIADQLKEKASEALEKLA
jgi:HEAT repeat protein